MARFFGNVGYVTTAKTAPGVYTEQSIVKQYYGEEVKRGSKWLSNDKINSDLAVTNRISIVADPFAYQNFTKIRWVEWLGVKWEVNDIQVERPRLILSLGGVYNAVPEQTGTSI